MSTRDEAGAASAVGAILLVALVVGVVTTVEVVHKPVWRKDAEAAHAEAVERQLLEVKVAAEGLERATGSVATVSMPLGPPRRAFLSVPGAGTLSFSPVGAGVTVLAANATLREAEGVAVGGLNETWLHVAAFPEVPDVLSLERLRLRWSSVGSVEAGVVTRIVVEDVNGVAAGSFEASVAAQAATYTVETTTRDATQVVSASAQSYAAQDTRAPYWIDVLEPRHLVAAVVAAADGPVRLRLEVDASGAAPATEPPSIEYAIDYWRATADGPRRTGGGLPVRAFLESWTGGVLSYASPGQRLVAQEFRLGSAGLVLHQDEGAAVRAPWHVQVMPGGVTAVAVSIPFLDGVPASATGTRTVSTRLMATHVSSWLLSAPALTLNVTTPAGAAWVDDLRWRLGAAGLAEGDAFAVSSGPNWATLTLLGADGAADGVEDVQATVRFARIHVTLEA